MCIARVKDIPRSLALGDGAGTFLVRCAFDYNLETLNDILNISYTTDDYSFGFPPGFKWLINSFNVLSPEYI